MKEKKTLPNLCATILMNEVFPRNEKNKVEIPPEITGILVHCEYHGIYTRRETREYLDKCVGLLEGMNGKKTE